MDQNRSVTDEATGQEVCYLHDEEEGGVTKSRLNGRRHGSDGGNVHEEEERGVGGGRLMEERSRNERKEQEEKNEKNIN